MASDSPGPRDPSTLDSGFNPVEAVLGSLDLLPFILLEVKRSHDGDDWRHAFFQPGSVRHPSWKPALASLLRVNEIFFLAGTKILWGELDALAPIAEAFVNHTRDPLRRAYWTCIRRLTVDYVPPPSEAGVPPMFWRLGFSDLRKHGPELGSPHLIARHVDLSEDVTTLLRVLCPSASLTSLNIEIGAPSTKQTEELLQLLSDPTISSQLAEFGYRGAWSKALVSKLPCIVGLRQLKLDIKSGTVQLGDLLHFSRLRGLKSITFTSDPGVVEPPLTRMSSVHNPVPNNTIKQVHIEATSHLEFALLSTFRPVSVRALSLVFVGRQVKGGPPFQIAYILRKNFERQDQLEELSIECKNAAKVEDVIHSHSGIHDPVRRQYFVETFGRFKKLRHVSFVGLSRPAAEQLSRVIVDVLPRWRDLVTLRFFLKQDRHAGDTTGQKLPDLSLFNIVKGACPYLEDLAFQLDEDGAFQLPSTSPKSVGTLHPLQHLYIKTFRTSAPAYGPQDVSEFSSYIGELYPSLKWVRGSAADFWDLVDQERRASRHVPT